VGIYLTINRKGSATLIDDSEHLGKLASANAQRKILVSIRIAGREIGFLSVESDRANAFGSEDRVLLERVAGLLARFLSGKGKYLVRRAGQPSPVPKAAAA
jgi:putative methionine-R-sulfoxide reductase with GAF domain